MSTEANAGRPILRVIRGDATDEEIAALLAVLVTRGVVAARPFAGPATSVWNDRAAGLRRPLSAGAGAWRASGWQR